MMKKCMTLLLALSLLLTLCSCGDNLDVADNTTVEMTPSTDNPGHYEAPTPVWEDKTTRPASESPDNALPTAPAVPDDTPDNLTGGMTDGGMNGTTNDGNGVFPGNP